MFLRAAKKILRCGSLLLVTTITLLRLPVTAAPTLRFDYGHGAPCDNAISTFMYFVPLISPEPVTVVTNAGNTQCARVISFDARTNGTFFTVTCEFEINGSGALENIFDHAKKIQQRQQDLQAGKSLKHQLDAINVADAGAGSAVIDGVFTNGQRVVNVVQLHFNRRGRVSPVTINLSDISRHDGRIQLENEMVARVNLLTFRRTTGTPKMEVTLASVKRKDAANSAWQNFVGSLKGATANLFLPPLRIEPEGQQAMLDFGLALASQKPNFTFPNAARLKAEK